MNISQKYSQCTTNGKTCIILLVQGLLESVLGQYELFTDKNTRDHLAWTAESEDPMHGVCNVYPTQDTLRMGTARGRSRHKSNSKRRGINMEERNVGTKGKSPKQDLTSAKD